MVIKLCLDLILILFRGLLSGVELAGLPAEVSAMILTLIAKLGEGAAIVNAYIDTTYIGVLFGFVLTVIALQNAYRLFMWIVIKIPFLNIK